MKSVAVRVSPLPLSLALIWTRYKMAKGLHSVSWKRTRACWLLLWNRQHGTSGRGGRFAAIHLWMKPASEIFLKHPNVSIWVSRYDNSEIYSGFKWWNRNDTHPPSLSSTIIQDFCSLSFWCSTATTITSFIPSTFLGTGTPNSYDSQWKLTQKENRDSFPSLVAKGHPTRVLNRYRFANWIKALHKNSPRNSLTNQLKSSISPRSSNWNKAWQSHMKEVK